MKVLAFVLIMGAQLAYGSQYLGTWKVTNVKCQSTLAKYIKLPQYDCTNAFEIKSFDFSRALVAGEAGIEIKSTPNDLQLNEPLHTGKVAIDKLCLRIRSQSTLETTSTSFLGTTSATSLDCVTGQMAAVSTYELTMKSNRSAVFKHSLNTNLPFYNKMLVEMVVAYELQR